MITEFADVLTIDSEKMLNNFFAACVQRVGGVFNPDTDFREYRNERGRRTFNQDFAKHLNGLMDQCFDFCTTKRLDIYEIALRHVNPTVHEKLKSKSDDELK